MLGLEIATSAFASSQLRLSSFFTSPVARGTSFSEGLTGDDWFPASAGMTEGEAGMTEGEAGMTEGEEDEIATSLALALLLVMTTIKKVLIRAGIFLKKVEILAKKAFIIDSVFYQKNEV